MASNASSRSPRLGPYRRLDAVILLEEDGILAR
jgi:hypothetical protein